MSEHLLRDIIADLLYDRLLSNGNQVTERECLSLAAEILTIREISDVLFPPAKPR